MDGAPSPLARAAGKPKCAAVPVRVGCLEPPRSWTTIDAVGVGSKDAEVTDADGRAVLPMYSGHGVGRYHLFGPHRDSSQVIRMTTHSTDMRLEGVTLAPELVQCADDGAAGDVVWDDGTWCEVGTARRGKKVEGAPPTLRRVAGRPGLHAAFFLKPCKAVTKKSTGRDKGGRYRIRMRAKQSQGKKLRALAAALVSTLGADASSCGADTEAFRPLSRHPRWIYK